MEGKVFGVTVSAVCRRLGITRQNCYARRKARRCHEVDAGLVVALVLAERRVQPRLGARKLHFMLKGSWGKAGVILGRDRFLEVLRAHALLLEPAGNLSPWHDQFLSLPARVPEPDQGAGGEPAQ